MNKFRILASLFYDVTSFKITEIKNAPKIMERFIKFEIIELTIEGF